jgi:hypothetical protein
MLLVTALLVIALRRLRGSRNSMRGLERSILFCQFEQICRTYLDEKRHDQAQTDDGYEEDEYLVETAHIWDQRPARNINV